MRQGEVKELHARSNETAEDEEFKSLHYLSLLTTKDRDFLLSSTGTQVKVSELEGRVIGLYFSANWYPPCQKFTRVLVNAYEQLKNLSPGFEVVFISSDEDLDAFNSYHACMPWLAVPFSDLKTKRYLNQRFDIEGIPCLIILDPDNYKDGAATCDGVELLYRYGAQAFPFTQKRLQELQEKEREKHENQTITNLLTNSNRDYLLSQSLPKQGLQLNCSKRGKINLLLSGLGYNFSMQVPVTSLKGKTIGLYFSAQWCLPGVKFTHKLISTYEKIKQELVEEADEDFEIVFVSTDNDQVAFDAFFRTMPWLAIPFGDPTIKNLTKHFDIQWIPTLVILGPNGKTVSKRGRNLINLYQENAYPFTNARVELIEKQMDEEARKLPESEYHSGHPHELMLVSEGNGGGPYICCACDEQGSGWAYQCIECGYEVHPKCIRQVEAPSR